MNPLFTSPFNTQGSTQPIAPLQFMMGTQAQPQTAQAPQSSGYFTNPLMQGLGGHGSQNQQFQQPGQGAYAGAYNTGLANMGNIGRMLPGTSLGLALQAMSQYGASQNDGYSLGSSANGYADPRDAAAMGLGAGSVSPQTLAAALQQQQQQTAQNENYSNEGHNSPGGGEDS